MIHLPGRIRQLACAAAVGACVPAAARAQEVTDPRAAQPERPTVATHAYTVAPDYWEVEAGGVYLRPAGGAQAAFPVVVKVGVIPGLQLDVSEQWSGSGAAGAGFGGGIGDLAFAAKLRVARLPVLGDFAVQPALKLATGSVARGTGTGTTDGSFLLISSHQLGPAEVDINTGVTLRSGDGSTAPSTSFVWTVSGGVPLGGGVGWTSEVFGYPGTSGPAGIRPQVGLLFGPTYTARKWLVFDTGAIVDLRGLGANSVYGGVTANLGRLF